MVPVGDAEALGAALVEVSIEPRIRTQLSLGGRATAARFTWDAAAEAHERVYARVGAPV